MLLQSLPLGEPQIELIFKIVFDRRYGHSKIIVLSIGILQRACLLHTISTQMIWEYLVESLSQI